MLIEQLVLISEVFWKRKTYSFQPVLTTDGSVRRWISGKNTLLIQYYQEGFKELRSQELLIEERLPRRVLQAKWESPWKSVCAWLCELSLSASVFPKVLPRQHIAARLGKGWTPRRVQSLLCSRWPPSLALGHCPPCLLCVMCSTSVPAYVILPWDLCIHCLPTAQLGLSNTRHC